MLQCLIFSGAALGADNQPVGSRSHHVITVVSVGDVSSAECSMSDTATRTGELSTDQLSPIARWVLLEGDRRRLALGLVLVAGVVMAALLWIDVVAVVNPTALTRLFSALAGGNLTLITVVVSINQLILSRELGGPGQIKERIDRMIDYRHAIEETAGADVSPVDLEGFLDFLMIELRANAEQLRAQDVEGDDHSHLVESYTETLIRQTESIRTALEDRPSSPFNTLMTILDTDLTEDLYDAERLRKSEADAIPDATAETLEDTYELLAYTGVARQYFKSLYMQRELTQLSQLIIYTGVPAVVLSILTVWLYGHPTGAILPRRLLEATVVLTTMAAIAPLAVLGAHLLRITTITRRTASLMPFEISEKGPL